MSTTTRDVQATIVMPEDATVNNAIGNVITTLRADQTGGRYSLVDFTVDPSSHRPPLHVHETFDELYHVLEGTLTVLVNDEQRLAPAGSSVFIPRGVVHTLGNHGDIPAHFLLLMSPGGSERCFDELASALEEHGKVTPADFAEIASRYDMTIVADD